VRNLQANVFKFVETAGGTVNDVTSGKAVPIAGATVQLWDQDGNVLSTVHTNAAGDYQFSRALSHTGTFYIYVVPPDGFDAVTKDPVTLNITRGGQKFSYHFGFVQTGAAPVAGKETLAGITPAPSVTKIQEDTSILDSDQGGEFSSGVSSPDFVYLES